MDNRISRNSLYLPTAPSWAADPQPTSSPATLNIESAIPADVQLARDDLTRYQQAAQLNRRAAADTYQHTQQIHVSPASRVQGNLGSLVDGTVGSPESRGEITASGSVQTTDYAQLDVRAQAGTDNRRQAHQQLQARLTTGAQMGGVGVQAQAGVTRNSAPHQPSTTTVRGQLSLAVDGTQITLSGEQTTGQGAPQTTLQAQLQRQIDGGHALEATYSQRQQGRERSQTIGVSLTGPVTDQTNYRLRAEHTFNENHLPSTTSVHLGFSREFTS